MELVPGQPTKQDEAFIGAFSHVRVCVPPAGPAPGNMHAMLYFAAMCFWLAMAASQPASHHLALLSLTGAPI